MNYKNISFLLFTTLLLFGCSAKTKGFIEDIYSQTQTREAMKQDYPTNTAKQNIPIIKDESTPISTTSNNNYVSDESQLYHGSGKIIDANFDKDVSLYIYAFVENGESDPITFYYNKDLRPIGNIVTITVKDNFLTKISQDNPKRTNQKRIQSTIKTPVVEKINTL